MPRFPDSFDGRRIYPDVAHFTSEEVEDLLPDDVSIAGRCDVGALLEDTGLHPYFVEWIDADRNPDENPLAEALNLCAAAYQFLRREREAPKHKIMVKHWGQMRTAAVTLSSLAKGGGVTGDPESIAADWMRTHELFSRHLKNRVEAGDGPPGLLDDLPEGKKAGREVERRYDKWAWTQPVPSDLFKDLVHPQIEGELAQAFADQLFGERKVDDPDWRCAWRDGSEFAAGFFGLLNTMIKVLDAAIAHETAMAAKARPSTQGNREKYARNWLLTRLIWIWRNLLGREPVFGVRKMHTSEQKVEPEPNPCVAFIDTCASKLGCDRTIAISSFADRLGVLRRTSLPEASLLQNPQPI